MITSYLCHEDLFLHSSSVYSYHLPGPSCLVSWVCSGSIISGVLCATEELYKKHLHDPDNKHGMITHLELDILECEVKWALESIPTNKASGGDGIPVELFQILKDDAVKGLHSIC